MSRKPTLLFLSGGSQVAQFILTALEGRRQRLRLLATSSLADDPGLWTYDRVYLVPVTAKQPQAFRERLMEILSREQIDLIVPCRDDDVIALAELAETQPEFAPRALCGPAALARMMHDKWASWLFCEEHGLPFARSMISGGQTSPEQFVRDVGFPLLAKPRDGFSGHGIRLLDNEAQLRGALERPNVVVQEYLGDPQAYFNLRREIETEGMPLVHTFIGLSHSIQVMIALSGEVAGVFASAGLRRPRIRTVKPDSEPQSLALGRRCGEVFSRLGWRGPVNIQCLRDRDGRVTIHEFNGRFTAVTADRMMLGYDEVALGIELFTGVKLPCTRWDKRPATQVLAQFVSKAADPADVAWLGEHREWIPGAAGK